MRLAKYLFQLTAATLVGAIVAPKVYKTVTNKLDKIDTSLPKKEVALDLTQEELLDVFEN